MLTGSDVVGVKVVALAERLTATSGLGNGHVANPPGTHDDLACRKVADGSYVFSRKDGSPY